MGYVQYRFIELVDLTVKTRRIQPLGRLCHRMHAFTHQLIGKETRQSRW